MMPVENNRVVAFRYIMRNSRHEILEDTMDGVPTVYLHGAAAIQSFLQEQLEGLREGSKKELFLPKSSGLTADDFTFDIIIDQVREASPEELMLGYPVQTAVAKCGEHCLCYTP